MQILLDECLPKRLKRHFPGHFVLTTPEAGWGGLKNGDLLRLAEEKFDVFITNDSGLEYQQNLASRKLFVIILHATSNDIDDLLPLIPAILEALVNSRAGTLVHVGRLTS